MKVSVVLTSYNHCAFIGDAINSFLRQKFQDFEIIVVDDASSDDSLKVIKSFDDDRIRLIELDENRGVSYASNVGIREARGEYVKIFASDDIANEDMLEKQVKFLDENCEYDVVFSKMEIIDEKGEFLAKKTKRMDRFFLTKNRSREEWLNHFFFRGNCLAAPTAIIRRESLLKVEGFDARFVQAQDFDLWVRLCVSGASFYVMDERLVKYRRIADNGNLSSNTALVRRRLVFDNEKILANFLKIKDVALLVKVFPNLKDVENKITADLIAFFIAKEALKVDSVHHRQFSLSCLFKVLESQENRVALEKGFGFSVNRDFAEIVRDNPLGYFNEFLNRKTLGKRVAKVFANAVRIIKKI